MKNVKYSIECKNCGALIPLSGPILPRYKICPSCKQKNYYKDTILNFKVTVKKGGKVS